MVVRGLLRSLSRSSRGKTVNSWFLQCTVGSQEMKKKVRNKILIKKTEMAKKTFLDVIFCTSGINLKISKRPENTIIILVYLLSKIFPFFNLIFAENYTLKFLKLLSMKIWPTVSNEAHKTKRCPPVYDTVDSRGCSTVWWCSSC